jgi:hypothetical protein
MQIRDGDQGLLYQRIGLGLRNDSQSTNNSSPISRFIFGQEVLAGGIAGSCENSSSNTISSCAGGEPRRFRHLLQQAFDNAYILELHLEYF